MHLIRAWKILCAGCPGSLLRRMPGAPYWAVCPGSILSGCPWPLIGREPWASYWAGCRAPYCAGCPGLLIGPDARAPYCTAWPGLLIGPGAWGSLLGQVPGTPYYCIRATKHQGWKATFKNASFLWRTVKVNLTSLVLYCTSRQNTIMIVNTPLIYVLCLQTFLTGIQKAIYTKSIFGASNNTSWSPTLTTYSNRDLVKKNRLIKNYVSYHQHAQCFWGSGEN